MIISVNWLKQFTDIDVSIDELATLIGSRLVEIEAVIDLGARYKDVTIARVVTCEAIPDSDHLSVCKIDDGGKRDGVERDENGYVQVVCGAPNVREGLMVAWLPPGGIVPASATDKEPFVLGARALRGHMSNGMLASAAELAIGDDHSGIVELGHDLKVEVCGDETAVEQDDNALKAGDSFAEIYELNDYLLDIENKSLTHRPDCFGIVGFAREVAAIQGKQFKTPEWLTALEPVLGDMVAVSTKQLTATIDNPELSQRYTAIVLSGAKGDVKSPFAIQSYLARCGVRPISAVVDTTNYLMLLTGQPLHAFDYNKVVSVGGGQADIHVRTGRAGEKLELLDGRTIELAESDIVIAAGETAIGLAGAMGGANTEIDDSTTDIILESATFNLYNLRGTQMRHGIFSEAITRFTKGLPPELAAPVLASAARLIMGATGAERESDIIDAYPGKREQPQIELTLETINAVLGTDLVADRVLSTLNNVEMDVKAEGTNIVVTPSYWRNDIHIAEDVIEEIGRINGYDSIAVSLPNRDLHATDMSGFDTFAFKLRDILARGGANEVLTYSFVPERLLRSAEQDPVRAFKIVNALSHDLQYYRLSLVPSLLEKVHPNTKAGFDKFALFELNKVHDKQLADDDGLPLEPSHIALVVSDDRKEAAKQGAGYYGARVYLDYLGEQLGVRFSYETVDTFGSNPGNGPFEAGRTALVKANDKVVGVIGEFKRSVQKAFKLPQYAAGFELDAAKLYSVAPPHKPYMPIGRFPGTERDICFKVDQGVSYTALYRVVQDEIATSNLQTHVEPVDAYQREGDTSKQITLRVYLTNLTKTIESDEAKALVDRIASVARDRLGAEVI